MTQRYAHFWDKAMQRASDEVGGILDDALSICGVRIKRRRWGDNGQRVFFSLPLNQSKKTTG